MTVMFMKNNNNNNNSDNNNSKKPYFHVKFRMYAYVCMYFVCMHVCIYMKEVG